VLHYGHRFVAISNEEEQFCARAAAHCSYRGLPWTAQDANNLTRFPISTS